MKRENMNVKEVTSEILRTLVYVRMLKESQHKLDQIKNHPGNPKNESLQTCWFKGESYLKASKRYNLFFLSEKKGSVRVWCWYKTPGSKATRCPPLPPSWLSSFNLLETTHFIFFNESSFPIDFNMPVITLCFHISAKTILQQFLYTILEWILLPLYSFFHFLFSHFSSFYSFSLVASFLPSFLH